MAWAYVRDAEADIEEEEKRVETFHQKILMAEEEARKATENEKSRMKEKKKLEEEIQTLAKESAGEEELMRQLQGDSDRKRDKARKAKMEFQILERKNEALGKDKKELERELEKLRSTGTEEFEERRRQREVAIQSSTA